MFLQYICDQSVYMSDALCCLLRWESVWIRDCFIGQQAVAIHGSVSRGLLTQLLEVVSEMSFMISYNSLLVFQTCCLIATYIWFIGSWRLGCHIWGDWAGYLFTHRGQSSHTKHISSAAGHSPLMAAYLLRIGCFTICPQCNSTKEMSEHLVLHYPALNQAYGPVFRSQTTQYVCGASRIGVVIPHCPQPGMRGKERITDHLWTASQYLLSVLL